MAIATRAAKQRVIQALKGANPKYSKPFEKGQMAVFSVMGGNWEEYAAIVMDMVAADTLLEIDRCVEGVEATVRELLIQQRLTNRLLMMQLGLTEEDLDEQLTLAITAVRSDEKRQAAEKEAAASRLAASDLKPATIAILRKQAAEGDAQAAEALRARGLLDEN